MMEWTHCMRCHATIYDKYARLCEDCDMARNREILEKKKGKSFAELTDAEREAVLEISKKSGNAALEAFWREYGKEEEKEMSNYGEYIPNKEAESAEGEAKPDILKNLQDAHEAATERLGRLYEERKGIDAEIRKIEALGVRLISHPRPPVLPGNKSAAVMAV